MNTKRQLKSGSKRKSYEPSRQKEMAGALDVYLKRKGLTEPFRDRFSVPKAK